MLLNFAMLIKFIYNLNKSIAILIGNLQTDNTEHKNML